MNNFIAKSDLISIIDESHCRWVYSYLRRRNWLIAGFEHQPDVMNNQQQVQKISNLIIESLDKLQDLRWLPPHAHSTKKARVDEMWETYKNSILTARDLRLLQTINDRVINAFWFDIRNIKETNPNDKVIKNLYDEMPLDPSPVDTAKRRECLIGFFNLLEWPRLEKLKFLERLLELAKLIQNFEKSFKWLDRKNPVQCDWAYTYIKKRVIFKPYIDPISTPEKYCASIALFDAWPAITDSKKLLLLDIRRAWSQKKHRDKLVGKKPYNFIMNKGLTKKLDVLSKKYDLSKNEIVEKIIESEFSKHFHSN